MTVPVRFHLHSLLECCTAGCGTTGQSVGAFVPPTATASISSAHDTALSDSVCAFLTNNNNWKAIDALDFSKFESQGGGLRLGSPNDVLDIAGILSALCAHPEQFRACWKCLIELCHCVLPSERHFSAQLKYLSSSASQMQCALPKANNEQPSGGGLDELLGGIMGGINSDVVSGLLNGTADMSSVDASKLISGVHNAVGPLIDKLEDGSTKQGIQMIVQGLMALAQQGPSHPGS
jgi:hypothetical protein